MPELPEVETVVRQLQPRLQGQRVRSLQVFDPRLELSPAPLNAGARIAGVERIGKQILLHFDKTGAAPLWLAVHLRMTGRLIWCERLPDGEKSIRARFALDRGELVFQDTRRFGTMRWLSDPLQAATVGMDPLAESFTAARLAALIGESRTPIKPWLLRQDRLVGMGNIYCSEALFRAGIDPRRAAASLSTDEIARLHRAIRRVLKLSIEHGGTTFSNFRNGEGHSGSFQAMLRVYGRETEPCKECGTPVERIVQAQRSTFFCPRCQLASAAPKGKRR